MEMSKCLCLMIIAVIVIASNASVFRERRSGNGYGGRPYQYVPVDNTYSNKQTSITKTSNNCNSAGSVCCNNQAESRTSGRGKRHTGGSNQGFYVYHPSDSNKQYACSQVANNGTSGDQTTGCSTSQSCCQGNQSGNGTLISVSCSSLGTR
ncbi:unnamed protein product [Adineta steineri]|uniref:Uncharacterized protein n=1 Tax=Adineta steineri TaxID=433720 RepID=A0A815MXB1_9BILA|nr:unnamed protein product [Adineta steineri]CAF1622465.1 unnamed protein product [Adineta steineri]